MSWRPENWEDVRFYACMNLTEGGGTYKNIYEVFEAGADAMLEVLKKEGWKLEGESVIPARGSCPEIHIQEELRGWLVFIPGEKE